MATFKSVKAIKAAKPVTLEALARSLASILSALSRVESLLMLPAKEAQGAGDDEQPTDLDGARLPRLPEAEGVSDEL